MDPRIPQDSVHSICERLAERAGGTVFRGADATVYRSGASRFYDRAVLTAGDDGRADRVVQDLLAGVRADSPEMVSYTREISGTDYDRVLAAHGFVNRMTQVGMAVACADIDPAGLSADGVERVGEADIDAWSEACAAGFGKPLELEAMRLLVGAPDCRFFAVRVDGRIVGTAMELTKDGNCGVHEVSTLPGFRGRGICTRLLSRILLDARVRGDRVVSLQASAAGRPVYERLGMTALTAMPSWMKTP